MEGVMICIFIIILFVCGFSIFYATIYNRFQEYIIRINEVESMIDSYLRNKYDLINKCIPIIKSIVKDDKERFSEIVKLRSRKIGNFELYRVLMSASLELDSLRHEFPDVQKSDELKKICRQIEDINIKIDNSVQYYNDNISIYNSLLKKFPSNIVAMVGKYKEKLFFDRKDMSDDDYDDFKL